MANTVVGLYEDLRDAEKVVRGLQKAGFARDDISLVARTAGGNEMPGAGQDTGYETRREATAGAMIGGAAGLVVGLASLLIPGIGPIIAAGPLATALAGVGVGAVAGGLMGVLTKAGVPEEHAFAYAEGLRQGRTLVMVKTPAAEADRAVAIMNQYSPIEMDTRPGAEEPETEPVRFRAAPFDGALPDHELDIAFREQTFEVRVTAEELIVNKQVHVVEEVILTKHVEERPETVHGTVRRTDVETEKLPASLDAAAERAAPEHAAATQPVSAPAGEEEWHANHDLLYAHTGRDYSYYEPHYRFGAELAALPRFEGRHWSEIEPDAQREWERTHPGAYWDDFKDVIRYGWERAASRPQESKPRGDIALPPRPAAPVEDTRPAQYVDQGDHL
jgi:hypothetical protein